MTFKIGDRICWVNKEGTVIHGGGWAIVKRVRLEDGWVHLGSQFVPEGHGFVYYYDPSNMRLCDENLNLI